MKEDYITYAVKSKNRFKLKSLHKWFRSRNAPHRESFSTSETCTTQAFINLSRDTWAYPDLTIWQGENKNIFSFVFLLSKSKIEFKRGQWLPRVPLFSFNSYEKHVCCYIRHELPGTSLFSSIYRRSGSATRLSALHGHQACCVSKENWRKQKEAKN